MSTTWTFAQFVDALKIQIEAVPAIIAFDPAVAVRVSEPHPGEDVSDVIVLGTDVSRFQEQTALGQYTYDEENTVACIAGTVRYGSGDVVAKDARDRVLDLVAIVDEEIRTNAPQVGTQTIWARVTDDEFSSYPADIGEGNPARVARVSFNIIYKARTNP